MCFYLGDREYVDLEDVFFDLRGMISKLEPGETLNFTEKEIDAFPYGLAGMTIIMRVFGMDLQAPRQNSERIIFKKRKANK